MAIVFVYTFTVDIEAQVRTEERVDYRAERSPLCCRSLLVDRRTGGQEQPSCLRLAARSGSQICLLVSYSR